MFEDESTTLDKAMIALEKSLTKYGKGNTAPVPVAFWQEWEPGVGETSSHLVWYATIHIRIPRVTEYEVEACENTLADAIRSATKALRYQSGCNRNARRDAKIYGYTL